MYIVTYIYIYIYIDREREREKRGKRDPRLLRVLLVPAACRTINRPITCRSVFRKHDANAHSDT